MPFTRHPHVTQSIESSCELFASVAREAVSIGFEGVCKKWKMAHVKSGMLGAALQYPQAKDIAREEAYLVPSNQVAIRGASLPSSSNADERRAAVLGLSDLHVDAEDAIDVEGANVYICVGEVGQARASAQDGQANDVGHLCIFPSERGGHGVRLPVLIPGWVCVVIFHNGKCLHGSVFPSSIASYVANKQQHEGILAVKYLPFRLRSVVALQATCQDGEEEEALGHIMSEARARDDTFLAARLEQAVRGSMPRSISNANMW